MATSTKSKTTIEAPAARQDILITREFDAPRELVFRAYTEADLFKQWMGPREDKLDLKTFDARSGGSWRYVDVDPEGTEWGFRGVFHTVQAPDLIIQTFEFEGMPGHACLETLRLESLPNNRTRVTGISVFQTVEDRDGMLESGMEGGVNDSFEKLDELLARLKK